MVTGTGCIVHRVNRGHIIFLMKGGELMRRIPLAYCPNLREFFVTIIGSLIITMKASMRCVTRTT